MVFETDTASISYELIREELWATHPPLLLLHSALGSSREFDKLKLCYEDRPLILLDLPSHGQSTTTRNSLSISDLAQYVHSLLIDHLQIPVVDIIGYSMGGYVAIELALMAPAVVRSIVSHAMKFYWTEQVISVALAGLDPETIRQRPQKGYDILSSIHQPNGFERTAMLSSSIIAAFKERQLTSEDVTRLQCALLLSVGDRDEMVPPEEVSKLYLELPKERTYLAIHANSPHPIAKLDLVSFTAAAREFWKTV